MPSTALLAAARNALAAGLPDGCIDTAAIVNADPSATADERAQGAILAARGAMTKELWSDALVWLERAGGRDAEVAAYCSWIHIQRGDKEAARVDAERAVGRLPADAAWYRAQTLSALDRRADAYATLAMFVEDKELGPSALRQRGTWRLQDGNRDEGLADLVAAARLGDLVAAARLHDEGALPDEPEPKLAYANSLAHSDIGAATGVVDGLLARTTLAPALRAKLLRDRAVFASVAGRRGEAVDFYKAAIALTPDDRELVALTGRALYNANLDDESLEILERAHAMAATDADGRLDAKIDEYLGDLHFVAQRPDKAVEHYRRSLARCPRKLALMSRCAQALETIGNADEAAALRFSAAVAGDEQSIEACDQDGVELPARLLDNGSAGLGRFGNPAVMAETLERAAELWLAESRASGDFCARHAAIALSNRAYALSLAHQMKLGDFRDAAVESARRAVEMRPGFRDGWNNYGNQLIANRQFDEALAAFDRAAWCDPRYAGAHYGKADAYRRKGDGEGTVAALKRAAEIGYEEASRQRDIHFRLARAYHALGKFETAEHEYRRTTELQGDEDYTAADALPQIATLVATGAAAYEPAPYRRYGLRPSTWHVAQTIAARVQLAAEPDEALREKLAEVIEEVIAEAGEIAHHEAAVFSGRFLEIAVVTDPDGMPYSDELPHSAFAALEAAVDAVHAIAPIVEAVGYNAIGLSDRDPGEQWSIATQPVPDAGPAPTYYVAFWPFAFAPQ
ncbi:MAG: hypothetical protein HOV81_08205 [Kofleriaceae bacterium]|nr:hypothetical protein [Kofleriaceae bacterium]